MGQEEGHKVKLDEYAQLAIGYDMAKARAWALDHARQNLPARYDWLKGLDLTWEITSARFMEDQDAYEVIVSCYPEGAEVQAKGEWLYHVDVAGQLMPGTPVLKSTLRFTPTATMPPTGKPSPVRVAPPETIAPVPRPAAPMTGAPPTPMAVVRYAGFWRRFFAAILDTIAYLLLAILFARGASELVFVTLWVTLWTLVFWIWRGQTPGKWLVGVKIVAADGSKLGFGKALLRYLVGYTLSFLTLGLGYFMIGFDKEKRGLHDRIASTRVVKVR